MSDTPSFVRAKLEQRSCQIAHVSGRIENGPWGYATFFHAQLN